MSENYSLLDVISFLASSYENLSEVIKISDDVSTRAIVKATQYELGRAVNILCKIMGM